MFANDLYHSQFDILASGSEIPILGEECYRFLLERQSEAIPQIFNLQSSIFNSGLSGLGNSYSKPLNFFSSVYICMCLWQLNNPSDQNHLIFFSEIYVHEMSEKSSIRVNATIGRLNNKAIHF